MLDLDALEKRVSESVGGPPAAPAPAEPDASTEGVDTASVSLAEYGARARAAQAHGDDEAFAQAILDIVHRGR